ncbi:MAG: DNA-binding protein [Ruminococcus sp.]|jgi:predicted DNA-binding protein YlxM (UPF0122 family)|nr:DNA-binding protein [Clostridia bacterium]MBQ8906510.1 DNA-binding protein [Ruminococcus sp.]
MFEKDMRLTLLLDHYGELLSEHRREIIEMYYCEDLSLAEIAENTGITRQGVRESIKKSEADLRMFESKLHLAERLDDLQKKCVTYSEKLEAAAASASDTAARQSILEIAESLKNVSV